VLEGEPREARVSTHAAFFATLRTFRLPAAARDTASQTTPITQITQDPTRTEREPEKPTEKVIIR
jgi:hypothetical protein